MSASATSNIITNDLWVNRLENRPNARLRLFCFPFAGGGTAAFRAWLGQLPAGVEIWAVQLPGREIRQSEAPATDLAAFISRMVAGLRPFLDQKPFAFYGHSMGGLLAFELIRELRRQALPLPQELFVSGRPAPQLKIETANYRLPEAAFVQKLKALEGTPSDVLDNAELRRLLLPLIRADFTLCETYAYEPDAPLDCPLTLFGGRQDPMVSEASLAAWQRQTVSAFSLHMFDGNHFFIQQRQAEFLACLGQALCKHL
jgi:medium-chain acyl-[acyl-carrier-protein] hydrolase